MGKIVIDVEMLGMGFMQVIFRESKKIAEEKKMDWPSIEKELLEIMGQEEFAEKIHEYFGDELTIYW